MAYCFNIDKTIYSLWRRANARNASFAIVLWFKVDPYQLVWYEIHFHFYAAPQISLETKPFIAKTMIAGQRMKQKSGFIKRVDKGWITTVKDFES